MNTGAVAMSIHLWDGRGICLLDYFAQSSGFVGEGLLCIVMCCRDFVLPYEENQATGIMQER